MEKGERDNLFQEKPERGSRDLKLGCHGSPSPRRLTHPTSGRSPDSRFVRLAAFPTVTTSPLATPTRSVAFLASPPRSQWRGRAGFSPASLLSFQKAPEAMPLLVTLLGNKCQGRNFLLTLALIAGSSFKLNPDN